MSIDSVDTLYKVNKYILYLNIVLVFVLMAVLVAQWPLNGLG